MRPVAYRFRENLTSWRSWNACGMRTRGFLALGTTSCLSSESEVQSIPRRLAKRRAAVFFGYSGTNYHGSQVNRETSKGKTVEEVLESAFYKAGLIADANYQDFAKLRWSRCSRTDKGVHAACNVVSLKIMVEPDLFESDDEGITIADRVNEHLPYDLRVFSIKRVSKSFRAREWCKDRTYKYYIPGRILGIGKDQSKTDAFHLLQRVSAMYIGNGPFHNFTVMKNYSNRFEKMGRDRGTDTQDTLLIIDEDRKHTGEHKKKRAWGALKWQSVLDPSNKVGPSHYRQVADFSVGSPVEIVDGEFMVPLRVQGTSFMYNQIRIMIGTAISVALGLIPIEAIPAFLAPPTRTRLPIAPAHTLILSGAGFHPFRKPHNQKHDFLFQGPIGTQRCTEYFEHVTLPEIKSSCELPEWDDWIEFVRETAPSLSEVQKLIELYTQWQNKRCMVAPLGTSI